MVTVMPYERVLHYRRGAFVRVLEPGRHRLWGFGHRLERVDGRTQLLTLSAQQVPTADGVTVKASATVQWHVVDPRTWHESSENPAELLHDAAKEALRTGVRSRDLDGWITASEPLDLVAGLSAAADRLGVRVETFAVRDVVLPADVRRAREDLLTASTRAQAALEVARGQTAVLRHLANAGDVLDQHPALAALKLAETAAEHGGTVVIERPAPRDR